MVANNLKNLHEKLIDSKESLFQLEAILVVPEIVLHINEKEISKLFIQSIKDCIEA